MAKKAAAKKPAKKSGGEILVVQSKVRDYLKGVGEFNIGSDLVGAVSSKVESILDQAAERAKGNNRKTIQARDV
ncbi:MAG: DUF1931 domain-containing protein [Candidatus Heimdallarchaeota archaeon]|nr:DUF1931 domain-containing protein [Candidatus Heimdallarchaeota archaeon]MDH5645779.1 DUF1931 domain-containing protein [Candidatus Heimdallarchaeota archaeon]